MAGAFVSVEATTTSEWNSQENLRVGSELFKLSRGFWQGQRSEGIIRRLEQPITERQPVIDLGVFLAIDGDRSALEPVLAAATISLLMDDVKHICTKEYIYRREVVLAQIVARRGLRRLREPPHDATEYGPVIAEVGSGVILVLGNQHLGRAHLLQPMNDEAVLGVGGQH